MSRSAEHDARNAALRAALGTNEGARAASQPTGSTVPTQCAELGLPWEVEDVTNANGARIHWVGARGAPTVLLYFHGGGFGLGAFPGHVKFLASCIKRTDNKLSVAFLEYGLTPTCRYPSPYVQAGKALDLVVEQGYRPSSILVGGDSCGGNMVLGLLSSILHPTTVIPQLKLREPLKGALLICPWVSFSADWDSYRANADSDIHSGETMLIWAHDYISPDNHNNYSEPVRAEVEWWKGFPVEDIHMLWGSSELFKDSNVKLAASLARAGLNVTPRECAKEVHIDCVLDAQSGLPHGEMSESAWAWLKKVCK